MRRLPLIILIAFMVVGFLVLRSRAMNSQRVESNRVAVLRSCEASNTTLRAVADVFDFMRQLVEANPSQTAKEKADAKAFFDGVSKRLQPVPCDDLRS